MYKNEISEYNSIGICEFRLNKILHTREAIALMNNNLPYNLIPKKFMGIFVINKTFDEVIKIASEIAVNFVINNILREEKYMLREEKRRPWAMKTRRPFRECIDKIDITFKDKIKLAEEVAKEIDLPLKKSKNGRPPFYD
ncbi:MAG TPA: hypothetical protein ENI33_04295, partial [Thermoplasmatales archaeon]|nr:hypothetical protein [Thermoplasmatales archaeon]